METRKGVLTAEQEDYVAEVLDFYFKFKNAVYEKLDGPVFKQLVRAADNMGADRIPEQWKSDLIPIIDAAMLNDANTVRLLAVDLLNKRIDIPKLDDEQELMVFDAFSKFIAAAIDFYMQKKLAK